MEADQDKQKVATAMLELAERAQAEAARQRDELRSKSIAQGKLLALSLIGALFGGWCTHILARIFQLPLVASVVMGAFGCGAVMYLFERRQIRLIKLESALSKQVRSYPHFRKRYHRKMALLGIACATTLLVTVFGGIYAEKIFPTIARSPNFQSYFETAIFFMFAFFILTAYKGWSWLHRVRCPNCKTKLAVRSRRPETPDDYSGLCAQCKILWDLNISNRSD